jgi:hypothetical protein
LRGWPLARAIDTLLRLAAATFAAAWNRKKTFEQRIECRKILLRFDQGGTQTEPQQSAILETNLTDTV